MCSPVTRKCLPGCQKVKFKSRVCQPGALVNAIYLPTTNLISLLSRRGFTRSCLKSLIASTRAQQCQAFYHWKRLTFTAPELQRWGWAPLHTIKHQFVSLLCVWPKCGIRHGSQDAAFYGCSCMKVWRWSETAVKKCNPYKESYKGIII